MPAPNGLPGTTPRSLPVKLLTGVGFVVVCLGLFAPTLFWFGTPNPVADTSPQAPSPAPSPDSPGATGSLLKMAGGVAVVAVACVLLTRYRVKRTAPAANPNLEVLASLPVDGRCAVHLVRVGDRRLLVGVDPAGVKAVTELTGGAAPAPTVIGPARVTVPVVGGRGEMTAHGGATDGRPE